MITRTYTLALAGLLFFAVNGTALRAQVITSGQIDSLVAVTLRTFDVPGIAVAIVKDGKIIHSKGYGVRSLNTMQKVDENTLFGIASNSKAFTVAGLGMLVDEKKISWDDKVLDYIPEFRMYNPYVTSEFTIRDLLTHRSGLGLGAGDLMFWPDSSSFTKKDMIHNLQYLKAASGFRTKFDYDNNLYMVAGEVLARVSGMSWEAFIQARILDPLGMTATAPSFKLLKDKSNVIDPHAPVDGKVKVIRRDWNESANAAGGIYSNLTDMCKWVIMQLNNGKYGPGLDKTLLSEEVHEDMWSPQTIIEVRGPSPYNTHFASYGLGWFLSDAEGYKQVTHTGGLAGIVTQVTLIPEMKLGIIVFTNQQSGAAFTAITNTIKDSYFGIPPVDRVKQMHDRVVANEANAKKITGDIWKDIELQQKSTAGRADISNFTGTYTDKWFGDVTISLKNGKPWFESKRSFLLNGEMMPYKGNTFVVKWTERSMDADAFVMFDLDSDGKAARMKMKSISPTTDFSFDFQDLDFTKTK
jgi:CubicO group peptidase (beta-lactamase class C family)